MIIKDERILNKRTTSYCEKQPILNIVFIIVGAQAAGRQENELTGNWKTWNRSWINRRRYSVNSVQEKNTF